MRIGINAVPLRMNGGGARYVFTELVERLLAIDDQNEYVIFAHPLALGVVHQLARVHRHLYPDLAGARVRIVEVGCEEELFDHRETFDLFFGPLNNLQPRIYDRPSVAILHDIQEQYFPEYFSEGDLRARNEIYPEICRSATTLVTISEFCKQTIIEKFGIEPDKIEVVYNAPQSGLLDRPADDVGRWSREPVRGPFFYYPANCYPHKNHGFLLDAIEKMRAADPHSPGVVFTGFELPGGFPLRAEIERRGLARVCRVHENLSVDELRYLYRHAIAMVMPTRFEGFGLPAVEALASGCPVVCSDLPPLREICGDCALYFPLDDQAALIDRLRTVQSDGMRREALIERGYEQSRHFTWNAAARRFLDIFAHAPARFRGYRNGTGHGSSSVHPRSDGRGQPRIGILVNGTLRPDAVGGAIRNILASGYRNVVVRVALPDGADTPELRQFLESTEVRYESVAQRGAADWQRLAKFSREEALDLVGEIVAGRNRLTPTGLHSLAWGWSRDGGRIVYLGETWQEPDGQPVRSVARLRQLGDGFWKLEGFVYPEMMYINPRALAEWPEGLAAARATDQDWRWELLKAARRADVLLQIRRTIAICDPTQVPLRERMRAAAGGIEVVYTREGRANAGSGWLRRLKPVLKPASFVLPQALRDKGVQIWRHLTKA